MKKLMIAAAASIAAVGAFAVESANVVGYNNTAARANLNWYTPCFRSIGVNTIDINDIQLNDGEIGAVGYGDSMQIVGPLGNPSEAYLFWQAFMDPTATATTPYWGDAEGNPVNVTFDEGDGIAIDNAAEMTFNIVGSGQVSTNAVRFAARSNLNWTGNPFPVAININAIQLDDGEIGAVGYGDSMQIVGPLGNPSEAYLFWQPFMDPTATATTPYWGDAEGNPVDVTLDPGAGFAIDNAAEMTFDIIISYPY